MKYVAFMFVCVSGKKIKMKSVELKVKIFALDLTPFEISTFQSYL